MEARRTQRSGASDPEVAGSHTTQEPLLLRPPPASIALSLRTRLFHFNKANPSYRGKLLITSSPPPLLLLLQTRAISFQRADRMRASLRLIGEKNVKGETEKEALTAAVSGGGGAMRRFGPRPFDKLAGGVALYPPVTSR